MTTAFRSSHVEEIVRERLADHEEHHKWLRGNLENVEGRVRGYYQELALLDMRIKACREFLGDEPEQALREAGE